MGSEAGKQMIVNKRFVSFAHSETVKYLYQKLESDKGCKNSKLISNFSFKALETNTIDQLGWLDLILLAPAGLIVIALQRWSSSFINENEDLVLSQCRRLNAQIEALRLMLKEKTKSDNLFIYPRLLLYRDDRDKFGLENEQRKEIDGVKVFGKSEWRELLDANSAKTINPETLEDVFNVLQKIPLRSQDDAISISSDYQEMNQESEDPAHGRFIFRARRSRNRAPVLLHVYDLTVVDQKTVRDDAEREFNTLLRLGKSRCSPTVIASLQKSTVFPEEFVFFAIQDTEAATLLDRVKDLQWALGERIEFSIQCLVALDEIHSGLNLADSGGILHRNLNPATIHVRSNGYPLFTDFTFARLVGETTISGGLKPWDLVGSEYVAPEIKRGGLAAAGPQSDTYSLCKSLCLLFQSKESGLCQEALDCLMSGISDHADQRMKLSQIAERMRQLSKNFCISAPQPKRPSAQFWDADSICELNSKTYRIERRLGSGGIGTTFLMYRRLQTKEGEFQETGPFVGKVFTNEELGQRALEAHQAISPISGETHLAAVYDSANLWRANELCAVLKWISGEALWFKRGDLCIYAKELGFANLESLILGWARDVCVALSYLHRRNLVHGDVSAKNIILEGNLVTLTDFDLVTVQGQRQVATGTPLYAAPELEADSIANPSHDIYALASTLFHMTFNRSAFERPMGVDKHHGVCWDGISRQDHALLFEFIERATTPNLANRFKSAMDALLFFEKNVQGIPGEKTIATEQNIDREPKFAPPNSENGSLTLLKQNEVPWLKEILSAYQASRFGNAETRGLDSDFAKDTYVNSSLDKILQKDIEDGKLSLVVLCGNAGDGKTAFLQNLGINLGADIAGSGQRIWEHTLSSGVLVKANLDGSAAHNGLSANKLLDQFFEPFHKLPFPSDRCHIIAINNGKLLEWIEGQTTKTYLIEQLETALSEEGALGTNPRLRFIDLNLRSLVGGVAAAERRIDNSFFDSLLAKMVGGSDVWTPCRSCSAQTHCTVFNSVRVLNEPSLGKVVRQRLLTSLQLIHQKGEVHITARSLRGLVSFVFFGTNYCSDLHNDKTLRTEFYYNRAFNPEYPGRQGELLRELAKLDPAQDSNPPIDHFLQRETSQDVLDEKGLSSLRRQAYFEWPDEKIEKIGGTKNALTVRGGATSGIFRDLAFANKEERERICFELCEGLSKLDDLPEDATNDTSSVALRIVPRTPTETIFWVKKAREQFNLDIPNYNVVPGLDVLPFQIILSYRYQNGTFEKLVIGAELFERLMKIKDGFQITDVSSDEIYANLSIFKQRLTQEADRQLYAWNPLEEQIFVVKADTHDQKQKLYFLGDS